MKILQRNTHHEAVTCWKQKVPLLSLTVKALSCGELFPYSHIGKCDFLDVRSKEHVTRNSMFLETQIYVFVSKFSLENSDSFFWGPLGRSRHDSASAVTSGTTLTKYNTLLLARLDSNSNSSISTHWMKSSTPTSVRRFGSGHTAAHISRVRRSSSGDNAELEICAEQQRF